MDIQRFERAMFLDNEIKHLRCEIDKLLNNDDKYKAIQIYFDNGYTIWLDQYLSTELLGIAHNSFKKELIKNLEYRVNILETEFFDILKNG